MASRCSKPSGLLWKRWKASAARRSGTCAHEHLSVRCAHAMWIHAYRHVVFPTNGSMRRLGELTCAHEHVTEACERVSFLFCTLIRDFQAKGEGGRVAQEGALEDGGDRANRRRVALRDARWANLLFAKLDALPDVVPTFRLEHIRLFQKVLFEEWVLAVEAAIDARHLGQLVDSRADAIVGQDGTLERAFAINRGARGRVVGLQSKQGNQMDA